MGFFDFLKKSAEPAAPAAPAFPLVLAADAKGAVVPMEQMEASQLARLEGLMDNLIPNISREDVPPALTALFSYMNDNPEVCHAFYGKNWESDFTRNAKDLIARRCLGQLQANGGGTQRQQYLLAFAVNGCFGSIVAWQDAGCQPPPEEMAAITWQAIRAVKALL